MSKRPEQLDDLFAELRAEPCRPASIDVTLEKRIMKEFADVKAASQRRRRWAVALAAAALVVGSAGSVGMAGGFDAIKRLFVMIPDGVVPPDGATTEKSDDAITIPDNGGTSRSETAGDADRRARR